MTRAEILGEIRNAPMRPCYCEQVPDCRSCTIAWLLQEIEYLNARILVACDFIGLLDRGL